jgi:hypothetical protein
MKARTLIKEIERCLDQIGEIDADIILLSKERAATDRQEVFVTKLEQGDLEEVIIINGLG